MLNWLSNLRLSLTQWATVTLGAIIGFLLLRLRLQNEKLHETRVKLLRSNHEATAQKHKGAVKSSREKYQQALKEYEDAKNRAGR